MLSRFCRFSRLGAVAQVVTRLSSELDIKLTPFSKALQEMGSVMGQEKATS